MLLETAASRPPEIRHKHSKSTTTTAQMQIKSNVILSSREELEADKVSVFLSLNVT